MQAVAHNGFLYQTPPPLWVWESGKTSDVYDIRLDTLMAGLCRKMNGGRGLHERPYHMHDVR